MFGSSSKTLEHREAFEKLKNLLYIMPLLIVLTVFIIIPIKEIFIKSLYLKKLNGTIIFIGLENYIDLFKKDYFLEILINTFVWIISTVILKNVLGLLLSLILYKNFPGKKIFSIVALLPWATPWIISAIMFKWIFDGLYGYLNGFLFLFDIISKPVNWLGTPSFSLWAVIITNVWTAIPFCGFAYLSVLYTIPESLYEAAQIDGANSIQKFFYITLPQLVPTIQLLALLTTIWGLNSFSMIYAMTGGGPLYSSETLVVHLYRLGFILHRPGQSNAVAVIGFIILTVFSVIFVTKGKQGEEHG